MQEALTKDQLSDITKLAKSKLEARQFLVIAPERVLHILEDLYWARLQERENYMYLQECQEILKDIIELADWESDEWDAVERLGSIRECLGIE